MVDIYVRKTGVNTNGGSSATVRSTGTDGVSNSTTTFTSASASWTSADVGHYIQVNTGTVSIRKIASVTNANTIVLTSALGTSESGRTWTVGGAFLTAQKALYDLKTDNGAPVAVQGDRVIIGPGDYTDNAWVVAASPGDTGLVKVIGDYSGILTGDTPGEIQLGRADLRTASYLEFRNVSFYPNSGNGVAIGNAVPGKIFRFIDCAFMKSSTPQGAATFNGQNGNFNVLCSAAATSFAEILLDRCYFWTTGAATMSDIYINYSVSGTTTEFSLNMTVRNCIFVNMVSDGTGGHIRLTSSNGATGTDSAIKLSDLTVTHCTFIGANSIPTLTMPASSGKISGVPTRNWKFYYNVGLLASSNVFGTALTSGQVTENNNVWASYTNSAPTIGTNVTAGANTQLVGVNNPGPFWSIGNERTFGRQYPPFTPYENFGSNGAQRAIEGAIASAAEDIARNSRPSTGSVKVTSGALERPDVARESSTVRTGTYSMRMDQGGSRDFLVPVDAAATTVSVYARYDSNYSAFKMGNLVAPVSGLLNAATNISVSPNGKWITVCGGVNAITGDDWNVFALDPLTGAIGARCTDPATAPGGSPVHVAWNPAGTYVAVSSSSSPYLNIYPFDDTTGVIGTKLANPATLPAGSGKAVAWSPDGAYVAIGHSNSPYVSVYPFSGGAIGTKVADPATTPTGQGNQVSWNPAGTYLAVGHTITPFVSAYPWSAGFGTKVADPASLPADASLSCVWSPDGAYLGLGGNTTPYVTVYPFTTGFGTKIADPASLPGGLAEYACLSWFAGGNYIAAVSFTSPYLHVWPWSAGFGTKLANPAATSNIGGGGLAIVGKGKFMFSTNEFAAATAVAMGGYRVNHAPTLTVLDGAAVGVTDAETQMVGPSGAWEQISLTFTPTVKGFVKIRLAAPGSPGSTTGKAFFDDFSVA